MTILASDFDNTLYVEDKNIVKENIESIKKFITQGNIFCIITGRNYTDIKTLLIEYNIPYSYLICEDGGKIFNNMDYCIETNLLEKDKVEIITSILEENNCNYFLDDGYNVTENKDDCVKIASKYEEYDKAEKILDTIKDKVEVYGYISREHININNKDIHKKTALDHLVEIENLNKNELHVIGDDVNDLEMIKAFNGVVIKKHKKELDFLNKKEYETLSDYIKELS